MTVRPPSDAAVTVRSLPRRFRGLFAGLSDDESPDALAVRATEDGTTALGLLVAAIGGVTTASAGLGALLAHDGASVPNPVHTAEPPTGTVEERLAELGWEADALAEQVDCVAADAWTHRGVLTSTGQAITALELLWRGVDGAVDALRRAERTLATVRGRPG